jgi:cytochrome c-type biogenesis protein CcmH/NrfG
MERIAAGSIAPALCACALLLAQGCALGPRGNDVYAQQQSAVLAYESGEDAKAEALFQGLVRAVPNDPENWLRLGNLYARSNRPEDAAQAYQKSLMLNPNDPRVWYNLGVVRQRQAYAAFLQANLQFDEKDPLHARTETLIKQLALHPVVPEVVEGAARPAGGEKDAAPK